jgi:hypothetical protein
MVNFVIKLDRGPYYVGKVVFIDAVSWDLRVGWIIGSTRFKGTKMYYDYSYLFNFINKLLCI